ncbi:hypothetical protein THF1C08_80234 [Vibrio jasicida]|uniref:Glycosyl transferase n=1 Tax=Vibrio jasicida TaxID=766224 RepID=A0AAU9QWH8_9VIBR|nr:hypothetical protein THF1C08_80234 [Vibrio jasicida]CAH1603514.1 hypothetical protein THF1A12_70233 [Vibrio jasicida]
MNEHVTYVATYGDEDYYRKALVAVTSMPRPLIWYVNDIQALNRLRKRNAMWFDDIEMRTCKQYGDTNVDKGMSMKVYGLLDLLSSEYTRALLLDVDTFNLGGAEEILAMPMTKPVMGDRLSDYTDMLNRRCSYADKRNLINGGVVMFDLTKLRQMELPAYTELCTNKLLERDWGVRRDEIYWAWFVKQGMVERFGREYNMYPLLTEYQPCFGLSETEFYLIRQITQRMIGAKIQHFVDTLKPWTCSDYDKKLVGSGYIPWLKRNKEIHENENKP